MKTRIAALAVVILLLAVLTSSVIAAVSPPSWVSTAAQTQMRRWFPLTEQQDALYTVLNDLTDAGGFWATVGNTGTTAGTNFVGTVDAKDLVFKAHNTEVFRLADGANATWTGDGATDLFNLLVGNLKVGNGTPSLTLSAEDAYVEGTLEADGAVRFDSTLDLNGDFDVSGLQGWGTGTSGATDLVDADVAFTPASGTVNGISLGVTTAPSAGATSVEGVAVSVQKTNSGNASQMYGVDSVVSIGNTYTGTVSSATGIYSLVDCEDVTCTNSYGLYTAPGAVDTGAVTNNYGVYVTTAAKGSGTITNEYGIWIADMAGGESSNYSLYAAGDVHLDSDLTVDDTFNLDDTSYVLTGTQTLTPAASYYAINAGDVVTITLADGSNGDTLIMANLSANNVVIADTNIRTTTGGALTLGQYDVLWLLFTGTDWYQVAAVATNS